MRNGGKMTEVSINEIKQSIKELAEVQKRGEEARIKAEENRQQREKKAEEARIKAEENRQKAQKALDNSFQRLSDTVHRVFGQLGNQWGKFIEDLVIPNAVRLLRERGIEVNQTTVRTKNPGRWEMDSLVINGQEIVALEVKKHLKKKHIQYFVKVLGLFKNEWADCKNKTLYGGIAFLSCDKNMEDYAEKQGLFVFQASADSAVLLNKLDFKPKAFDPMEGDPPPIEDSL